jgi:hypothetical protein
VAIGTLTLLDVLQVFNNQLTGTLPAQLSQLTALTCVE